MKLAIVFVALAFSASVFANPGEQPGAATATGDTQCEPQAVGDGRNGQPGQPQPSQPDNTGASGTNL